MNPWNFDFHCSSFQMYKKIGVAGRLFFHSLSTVHILSLRALLPRDRRAELQGRLSFFFFFFSAKEFHFLPVSICAYKHSLTFVSVGCLMESLLDSKNGTINTNYPLLSSLRLFLNRDYRLQPTNINLRSEMLVISESGWHKKNSRATDGTVLSGSRRYPTRVLRSAILYF